MSNDALSPPPAEPSAPVAEERVCPVCGREEAPGERCHLCPSDLRQEVSATGAPVARAGILSLEERLALKTKEAGINSDWANRAAHELLDANARITALEAENAALREKVAAADRALEPFAGIGAWLFARDLPDAMPLVDILGINGSAGSLTRGHFKAAHTARALLQGQGGGDDTTDDR